MTRPLGHTSSVPHNSWTERAWIAIARETTDSGRVWRKEEYDVRRTHTPLQILLYLGRRVARTRPPEPSTDEIVDAEVRRRQVAYLIETEPPLTSDAPTIGEVAAQSPTNPHVGASLVEAHGPTPNMRDLFYDLLQGDLSIFWTPEEEVAIMEAFDAAQSAVANGLARRFPS